MSAECPWCCFAVSLCILYIRGIALCCIRHRCDFGSKTTVCTELCLTFLHSRTFKLWFWTRISFVGNYASREHHPPASYARTYEGLSSVLRLHLMLGIFYDRRMKQLETLWMNGNQVGCYIRRPCSPCPQSALPPPPSISTCPYQCEASREDHLTSCAAAAGRCRQPG